MRSIIFHNSFFQQLLLGSSKGPVSISVSSASTQTQSISAALQLDDNESNTSRSDPAQTTRVVPNLNGIEEGLKLSNAKQVSAIPSEDCAGSPRSPTPTTNNSQSGESYWRAALNSGKQGPKKLARTHTIVVTGPAGLVLWTRTRHDG